MNIPEPMTVKPIKKSFKNDRCCKYCRNYCIVLGIMKNEWEPGHEI